MNSMKKALCACAAMLMCFSAGNFRSYAAKTETFDITGYDVTMTNRSVVIYPAGESKRVIKADEYGFREAYLLIFDSEGRLVEGGEKLRANTDGTNGSPQTSVTVPAGGFMVAFGTLAPSGLLIAYTKAMEGAMLYNATMSLMYDMTASYDRATNKLTLNTSDTRTTTDKTVKFLFVGNSSTYFNGTPLKFRAVCEAAGLDVSVDYCTVGSAYLYQFADENHSSGKLIRQKLADNKYDYVVLQDAGSASRTQSDNAVSTLLPLIEENGAEALLYMRYSASSYKEGRLEGATEHYRNYTALSKKYNLKVSPVAVAFLYCTDEYPAINLYADDNSHHSKEGSYLAACTWLYSYMGISPIGNTYTAGLDAETVTALQKCAYKACTTEFIDEEKSDSYVENGVKYINLSRGMSYTADGGVYSGTWTDTASDGKPLGKLTDGIYASYGGAADCGCYKGKTVNITIDLGEQKVISRVNTDLYGNSGWGIPDPDKATVSFSFSSDGTSFTEAGSAVRTPSAYGEWNKCEFDCKSAEGVTARYVRVTYNIDGNFCWTSEIAVFGPEGKTPDVSVPDVSEEESAVESTAESHTESAESSVAGTKSGSSSLPLIIASAIAGVLLIAALGFVLVRRKK